MKKVAIGLKNVNTKSGLGKIVLEQVKYFVAHNIQIDIYAQKCDAIITQSGANFIKIGKIPLIGDYYNRLYFANAVEKQVRHGGYDLIVGHGDLIDQDMLFIHNLTEKAYEMIHGKPMGKLSSVAKIRRLILEKQHFKVLVANSELMKKELVKTFGIAPEKIDVIYPGYDPTQFNTDNAKAMRQSVRSELKVDNEMLVIGFITSGNFKKRALDRFIDALHRLNIATDYRVLLAGKDKELPHFMAMAENYGLADKFIVRDPINEVEHYFHAVDVVVHPAYFEEFGMVVEEAMACGIPVITSRCVGASEIIGDDALIMEEPSIEAIMEKLSLFINEPNKHNAWRQAALDSVTQTDWEHYIDNFIKLAIRT